MAHIPMEYLASGIFYWPETSQERRSMSADAHELPMGRGNRLFYCHLMGWAIMHRPSLCYESGPIALNSTRTPFRAFD